MTMTFKKAERKQAKARIAIAGPSGSGKTYTALRIARGIAGPEGRIAVIDTEKGSASLYADEFDFDALELDPPFTPARYVEAIETAEAANYDVILVDSISHEWNGSGGAQEMVDAVLRRLKTTNTMMGWKEVTPQHTAFIEKLVRTQTHLIATIRSKTAYEIDKNSQGQTTVRKLGMAPVQRDGVEYEFTVFGDLDLNHQLTVTKSRMRALQDQTIHHPDERLGQKIMQWLNSGEPEARPAWIDQLLDNYEEFEIIDTASRIAPNGVFITRLTDLFNIPPEGVSALRAQLPDKGQASKSEETATSVPEGHADTSAPGGSQNESAQTSSPQTSEGGGSAQRVDEGAPPSEGVEHPCPACGAECKPWTSPSSNIKWRCTNTECTAGYEGHPWTSFHADPWKPGGEIEQMKSPTQEKDDAGGNGAGPSPEPPADSDEETSESVFARIDNWREANHVFKRQLYTVAKDVALEMKARVDGRPWHKEDIPLLPVEVLLVIEKRLHEEKAAADAKAAEQEAMKV